MIAEAIRRQVRVGLRYRPTDAVERIVEPHVLWRTTSDNACLFCLQVVSEIGTSENDPKHLDPYQMTSIRITDEPFDVDPVFKRNIYENIIAVVAR